MHTLADIYHLCLKNRWQGSIIQASLGKSLNRNYITEATSELLILYKSAGIRFGDRVIVKTDHSYQTILTMICLWSMGTVVVPVKKDILEKELDVISKDCNARFIIEPNDKEIINSKFYQKKPEVFITTIQQRVSGSDLALIIYTSGSAGKPKGVMLTHNNVITALNSIIEYLNIIAQDIILCISPISFDYGLYNIFFAFKTGCTVVLYDKPVQPLILLQTINKFNVTILPVVPAIAISIERTLHLFKQKLDSLKKITNTGGHLPEVTINGLRKKMPFVKIFAMYGLTESKRALYLPPEDIDRKRGSVGIPMPGLEAKIFKEQYQQDGSKYYIETETNEIGVLYLRGASVMQRYCDTKAKGGTEIISGEYRDDNWLNTGDLFLRDEEGYFYFKGRSKDLIKQGGYCIYPRDIEDHVLKHPNVYLCTVLGQFDQQENEIAHIFINLQEDSKERRDELRKWLSEEIDSNSLPRKITFSSNIPLTDNGKIDKAKLATI